MWCGAVVNLVPFIGPEAVGDSRMGGRIDGSEWIFIASVSRREGVGRLRQFVGEEKRWCDCLAPRGAQDRRDAQDGCGAR
jgi:hypothetical protein